MAVMTTQGRLGFQARARTITAILAAAAIVATPVTANSSDDYPNRPIRIIVPWPAGGSADNGARRTAKRLSARFGQPVVVENRPGATGTLGTALVNKVAPDGYTLFHVNDTTMALNRWVIKDPGYDPVKDFQPIMLSVRYVLIAVVNAGLPVNSIQELAALARKTPGGISYASWGYGGGSHLVAETFAREAGIQMLHVPYKGEAPAVTDVAGGHAHLMFMTPFSARTLTATGRLKALAVTGPIRMSSLPDLPSMRESGFPASEFVGWSGWVAPAGTPRPIVDKLYRALAEAFQDPEVIEYAQLNGYEIVAGPPDDFAALIRDDLQRFGAMAKAAGLSTQ